MEEILMYLALASAPLFTWPCFFAISFMFVFGFVCGMAFLGTFQ